MKIYTKKGDGGESGLLGGQRASKAHSRFEVLGALDELNSSLGVLVAFAPALAKSLQAIQMTLFDVGALLGCPKEIWAKFSLKSLSLEAIEELERQIDELQEPCGELKAFILPGGVRSAALVHVSRAICRRAERELHRFYLEAPEELDSFVSTYMNRLSDYLFTLARNENHKAGREDVFYKSR